MRVALIGPASTGKTTLAHAVSRERHLPVISECIRTSAQSLGIKNISEVDDHTRIMLQTDAIRLQQSIEGIYGRNFVSDRASYDYYAYVLAFFGITPFTETYKHVASRSEYDLLVYVPPFDQVGQRNDGFRLDASAFAKVEESVRKSLGPEALRRNFNVKTNDWWHYLILKATTTDERLAEIFAVIDFMETRFNT